MSLYGNAFLDIRNKYVIPIVQYGTKRKKYASWNLKKILTNDIISITKNGNQFQIEIPEEYYYISNICDIELFYNKTLIQLKEYNKIKSNSSTWSYVTLYYFLFFSATTLLRFCNRGYIFLDSSKKKLIEDFYLAAYGTPIQMNSGSYYFEVTNSANYGNVIVKIHHKSDGVHKLTLNKINEIIRNEIIPSADIDELSYFTSIKNITTILTPEFPSSIRNKLNYTSESSILDIEGKIPKIDFKTINNNLVRNLSKISVNQSLDSIVYCTAYYASIIFNYIHKLHQEYNIRSPYGKDFEKERATYIPDQSMILK